MRRIGHVQETPGDVEVAVLKLTTADHDDLHRRHEQFINERHVFSKTVRSLALCPESHPGQVSASPAPVAGATPVETWMSVVIHKPACACVGTCTPLTED